MESEDLQVIKETLALLGAQQAALAAWLTAVHVAHPARDAIPALFDALSEPARVAALNAPLSDALTTELVERVFRSVRARMTPPA